MSARRWLEGEGQVVADLLRVLAGGPLSQEFVAALLEVCPDPYAPDVKANVLGAAIERRYRADFGADDPPADQLESALRYWSDHGKPLPADVKGLAGRVLAQSRWLPRDLRLLEMRLAMA